MKLKVRYQQPFAGVRPLLNLCCFSIVCLPLVACAESPAVSKQVKSAAPVKAEVRQSEAAQELTVQSNGAEQVMTRNKQVLYAQAALAERLAIGVDAVGLPSLSIVTWRSGALGCPMPNTMYTQALVPGVLMIFKVDQKLYRYHASSAGIPFYCPASRAEPQSAAASDI